MANTKEHEVPGKEPEVPLAKEAIPSLKELKRRPLKTFWEDDVSVAIWAREREARGEKLTFYVMTFSRRWVDTKEKVHYSDSFDLHQMSSIMRLAKLAQSYVEPLLYPELKQAQ